MICRTFSLSLALAACLASTLITPEVTGKRLELLKEMVPGLSRVAAVHIAGMATFPVVANWLKENEIATKALGLKLQILEVGDGPNVWENAFQAMVRRRAGGLTVIEGPKFLAQRAQIATLAAQHRLPAIYPFREYVEAGGLMSYGANIADLHQRAATFVDKILKGTKPAELPVEQPTKFDLVINLKTAKALGLSIPQFLRVRADQVIQ